MAGRGGMGVVYRATQLALERTVALKVIAPELASDDAIPRALPARVEVAASIDHPNVIPIYDAGEEDGVLYIAMRYVDGRRPAQRSSAARAGWSPRRGRAIVAQVGAALDAAHARGLVHRDVKPANILLGRRRTHVYLTDFGLTKHALADGERSRSTGHCRRHARLRRARADPRRARSTRAPTSTRSAACSTRR